MMVEWICYVSLKDKRHSADLYNLLEIGQPCQAEFHAWLIWVFG